MVLRLRGATSQAGSVLPESGRQVSLPASHAAWRGGSTRHFRCSGAVATRGGQRKRRRVQAFGVPGADEPSGLGALAFTKSRQLVAGRVAMQGFAWSVLCEHLTGSGPLTVIGIETGVPFWEVDAAVLLFLALNTTLALLPSRGTFITTISGSSSSQKGAPYGATDLETDIFRLYVQLVGEKLGLTKERELFIGRCAQLGLSAAIVAEAVTGRGLLQNLDVDTGLSLEEADPHVLVFCVILILIGLYEGRGKFSE